MPLMFPCCVIYKLDLHCHLLDVLPYVCIGKCFLERFCLNKILDK